MPPGGREKMTVICAVGIEAVLCVQQPKMVVRAAVKDVPCVQQLRVTVYACP
jgi:hypothetical protein